MMNVSKLALGMGLALTMAMSGCTSDDSGASDGGSSEGGGTTGGGTAGGTSGTTSGVSTNKCTMVLTGAVAGTFPCSTAIAGLDLEKNHGIVVATHLTTEHNITIGFEFPDAPKVTTYNTSTTGLEASALVNMGSKNWEADIAPGDTPTGTLAMTLTSSSEGIVGGDAKVYLIKGEISGNLVAVESSGAAGNVTVKVTFE